MRQEASESSWQYIELVPEGDICDILKGQQDAVVDLLTNALGNKAFYRYAADKWTAEEVVGHLNDTERVFAFRAFRLARGLSDALPGFDQLTVAEWARRAPRDWPALIDEFETLRTATLQLVRPLEESVWTRSGTISDMQTSVRALVYGIAGHTAHHVAQLRTLYL